MRLPETVQWTPGETGTKELMGQTWRFVRFIGAAPPTTSWVTYLNPPKNHGFWRLDVDWVDFFLLISYGIHSFRVSVSNEPHVFLGSWGWCRYTTCSSVPRSWCISVNIKKGNVTYLISKGWMRILGHDSHWVQESYWASIFIMIIYIMIVH